MLGRTWAVAATDVDKAEAEQGHHSRGSSGRVLEGEGHLHLVFGATSHSKATKVSWILSPASEARVNLLIIAIAAVSLTSAEAGRLGEHQIQRLALVAADVAVPDLVRLIRPAVVSSSSKVIGQHLMIGPIQPHEIARIAIAGTHQPWW